MMEFIILVNDINTALNNLREWEEPEYMEKSLMFKMHRVYVQREPLGTVLIVGAWNYPLSIPLQPLVGAIAGGEFENERVRVCIVK